MAMQPCDYELECVQQAVQGNIIINLPAGAGKCVITSLVIDHYCQSDTRKVMIVVPTRVLISQQAVQLTRHCSTCPRVAEIHTQEIDFWSQAVWDKLMFEHDVLVGTPQIFHRAFVDAAFIHTTQFSLIIFDECHSATGNSPMASFMRDIVWPIANTEGCPRIFGLTSSFVSGSLRNSGNKRQQLEAIMQAELFCPDVPDNLPKRWHRVFYESFDYTPAVQQLSGAVKDILASLQPFGVPLSDPKKVVRSAGHILEQLGLSAFLIYLRQSIIPQVERHAVQIAGAVGPHATLLKDALPHVRLALDTKMDRLQEEAERTGVPPVSPKAEELVQLLKRVGTERRIIVFVEQVVLTVPLAQLIDSQLRTRMATTATGLGCMKEAMRKEALALFASGERPVMVSTSALEEGIDVPGCGVVIRFNGFSTTKSHIQGSSHARHQDAEVYYFDNDPKVEQDRAQSLTQVARDSTLTLSQTQRLQHCRSWTTVSDVHPFRLPGEKTAEINVLNCLQIVYEFTAKVMGQCVPQDMLLCYKTHVEQRKPSKVRRMLVEVRHPSPDGMVVVTLNDVNKYWGGVKITSVLDPVCLRTFIHKDLEKRYFLFVVAVFMAQRGYLTTQNQPSERALLESKAATPELRGPSTIKIKSRRGTVNPVTAQVLSVPESTADADPELLHNVATSSTSTVPVNVAPEKPTQPQTQQSTLPQSSPEFQLSNYFGTPQFQVFGLNARANILKPTSNDAKVVLNELSMRIWPHNADRLFYTTQGSSLGPFWSTVWLPIIGKSFTGMMQSTKKQAERSAAAKALAFLQEVPGLASPQ